jgi:hypothetical protein
MANLFNYSNIIGGIEGCTVKEGDYIKNVRFSGGFADLVFSDGWTVQKVGGELGIIWENKKEFTPFSHFASSVIFEKA